MRGGAAYGSYQDFVSKSKLDTQIDLKEYSVSNRGLRPNLIGTPDQVAERIVAFANVGVSTLLLQFSPHLPEMQRFAAEVIPRAPPRGPARRLTALRAAGRTPR